MWRLVFLFVFALFAGCAGAKSVGTSAPVVCELGASLEVLVDEEGAQLVVWEIDEPTSLRSSELPDAPAYQRYRGVIERAGADLRVPVWDPPEIESERMAEVWRREFHNIDMAASGEAGEIRPVECWEALMLARRFEEHDALTESSEFIAAYLVKDGRARVYYGAGPGMFPPRRVYPFDHVAADVAKGWRFERFLHNHTVTSNKGAPALGVAAPSTNDVMLSKSLIASMGLEFVLVTNGFYTVEIPAGSIGAYEGPAPNPE